MCAGTRGEWKISWCTRASSSSSSSSSSSLFRTAAAVVWLLSIFQNRRGKRDKPEDVASTCPVSVKTHLQAWLSTRRRGRWREREGKKEKKNYDAVEHDLFLIPLLPLLSEEESGDEKSRGEEKIFKHFPPILFPPSPINCVKCIHYLIVIRASLKLFCIRFTIKISSIRSESIFEPLALIMFSSLFFFFFSFDFSKSLKFQDF